MGDIGTQDAPQFEVKNVSFKYDQEGDYIIEDVSYKFEKGKTYGINGSSGSGKSTLFNLIAGLLHPSTG